MIKFNGNLCPVKILQNCFNFASINDKSDEYFFRAITKTKTMEKLRNVSKFLSYTSTRKLLLESLVNIWLRKEGFGLHSIRIGGAKLPVNKRVKDRLFKRYGR